MRLAPTLIMLSVILSGLFPTAVVAQRDTRQTREAAKYLGLASSRPTKAGRDEMLREALTHLRVEMQQDASNAKVWLMAGAVLAQLGDVREADAAFMKAQQLHPAYEDEISNERESGWVEWFNNGIIEMNLGRNRAAIQAFENAQVLYRQRPEALMNLGMLYLALDDKDEAVRAFREAIEATHGPLFQQLDLDGRDAWIAFRAMAEEKIAEIEGGG
jgi:Flp pilus assembly protein TadD